MKNLGLENQEFMFVSLYSMTVLKHEISRPGEPGVYVRLSVYYDWIKA